MKKIFIGSSTEALHIARTIQSILIELGVDTTLWKDRDAFPIGHYTTEYLIKAAHEHSGGVFIFNHDDAVLRNGETKYLPRDNVIAETGMFIGVLGVKSVVLCTIEGVHEISDFKGITTLPFKMSDLAWLKSKLKNWLDNEVKDYRGPSGSNNVLMLPRCEIHDRYSLDSRLHISDNEYKQIRHIRIMNFASNLVINPEVGEIGHIPPKDIVLSDAIKKIMMETDAKVDLILTEPNEYNLQDLQTKIANCNAGSPSGAIYSALATLYKNLTTNTIYNRRKSVPPILFRFYTMKISIPFAIFNIEFVGSAKKYNHVKVDLYSACLDNEDQRRSFVIWEVEDPSNYKFFIDNFNNIIRDKSVCEETKINKLEEWAKCWEELSLGGA